MSQEPRPSGLWKQLLRLQYPGAAAGLLCDVFHFLNLIEQDPLCSEGEAHVSCKFREEAMVMLNDQDGTALNEWVELYRSNPSRFEQRVQEWAEHCVEHSLFE